MTTAELARLVIAARRWPHRRRLLPETTRVTAHDLMLRLGRRASERELRVMREIRSWLGVHKLPAHVTLCAFDEGAERVLSAAVKGVA